MCCQAGLGGGAPDAGSGPSLWEFPHGGANACTPRQGVTLLYGPSICTRSVQMDLRCNQVRRPFPTPGSGTLWVSRESLRDRRVSCLPRWTVCPTRSPSQDTNRSTCRGEFSWSGPLAIPPGRCHLGPLANGPGRNPPYCLRSGGADTDRGGVPEPLRSGTSPASFAGSCHPGPPHVRCGVGRCLPAFFPRGVPLSRAPCRATWLLPCPVCPCCLPLLWGVGVLCFFFLPRPLATRLSPGVSVCPLPPPTSPRCLLAVLAPFLGGWRRRGWGEGASSLPVLWRKHVASRVQARGAALVPLQGGGGVPCGSRRRPSYPAFAPPVPPPPGFARRVLSTGTVVWSVPHPLSAASQACRFVLGGGGGALSAPPYLHLPPLGGRRCGGGGGLVVFPSLHACRRHDASTAQARGAAPVRLQGGGPCHVAPVIALSTLRSHPRWSPRWGSHGACSLRARSCGPSRTLSPLPPHPAALSSGGPLFAPPLPASPTLGGAGVCVGGRGGPCHLPFVARTSQARRKHGAGTRRGTCPSAGGGGACRVSPVVAPPTLRAHPRGGGGVWGGRPCRRPFVARMSQARRKHDASTG